MRKSTPEEVGMSSKRLRHVDEMLRRFVDESTFPAVAICIARRGAIVLEEAFGRLDPRDPKSASANKATIFLIASLTKPVVTSAFMLLIERGKVLLDEPVMKYIPEFAAGGKDGVKVRHLLTHTSGLPDMVPSDEVLRKAHAPMSEFVKSACESGLLFAPGTDISYQSAGILMLAEIIQRLEGVPIREFLHREFFQPLRMHDTYLGLGELPRTRLAQVNISEQQSQTDWHWNSDYWRDFGAPWGGLHSTVGDYMRFLQIMLHEGKLGDRQIFAPLTVRAMIIDQTSSMETIPRDKRARMRWGFGWRIHSTVESAHHFGDLVSDRTFGHAGATGTVAWADPARELACVIFTTQPGNASLERISNAVVASVVDP